MKIKNVIKKCKSHKTICVVYAGSDKWLGDGKSLFLMPEFMNVDMDALCGLYDFSETEQQKMVYVNKQYNDTIFNFNDDDDDEVEVEILGIDLLIKGTAYCPIKTDDGIIYIDKSYFQIFDNGITALKKRVAKDGSFYIVIKEGFMLTGIIIPENLGSPKLKDTLKMLYETMN